LLLPHLLPVGQSVRRGETVLLKSVHSVRSVWLYNTAYGMAFHGKKVANSQILRISSCFFSLSTIFSLNESGLMTFMAGPKLSILISISVSSSRS